MKVKDLISKLSEYNENSEIRIFTSFEEEVEVFADQYEIMKSGIVARGDIEILDKELYMSKDSVNEMPSLTEVAIRLHDWIFESL